MIRILAAIVVLNAAAPALAFDCTLARTPVEKAICADPAARQADEALETVFRTTKTVLEPGAVSAIVASQRAWLEERNVGCASETPVAACVAARDRDRVLVLSAQPKAGPGLSSRLVPVFVAQPGSKTDVAVDVVLFRFVDPASPGAKALNPQVEAALKDIQLKKDAPDDADWTIEQHGAISYASDHLLSIPVEAWTYTGGAHGTGSTSTINIDPAAGKALAFRDLADPKAENVLFGICRDQVAAQEKEKDAVPTGEQIGERDKGLRDVLTDLASWTFAADHATVTFDPYTVGSYAEGSYNCTLRYAELKPLVKTSFPLP